ncbi:aminotransferase class V-fold PLP-dependent enzyme [Aliishimia ponticola]|uniref:Aminotransferase class V-fold PLP-dependent enzyme n=1 Tax=Aliishimia ponticola TaxID=2499833 RepID=A0A4S4NCY8_9RHOB|nr:aminotransferase class V-fold PLP-dependent enzyme [Aliishimia ponticola]THH37322.1 aminotransferase class V-fold PLP-dependent enzyme [Aliishimia ponticola]
MPGRDYLAIPGPSVMPDAVLSAMHRAAPNIYEGALVDMAATLGPDLRRVARTQGHVAMYIGNGHAAWEAALSNVVASGDTVLVPATGRFGHGWADTAQGLGVQTEILDFGKKDPFDLARVEEALAADTAHRIKAVLAVHVDTSTSVRNDIAGLRAALDRTGHPALLMADCIASLGCDVFEMDAWGVDVMVTGSQKGLMVPPGMCFVFFNDKAASVRAGMAQVSRYWDWTPRANPEQFFQYWNGTAPTQHLYGLRAALDMLMAEGMEAVWKRHDTLARAIWAACDVWAEGGALSLNVADPDNRSRAVTSLRLDQGRATALRRWTEGQISLTLGIGLGMAEPGDPKRDDFFRLGHMGHLNGNMVMGMLGGIEAGLRSLDVPIGDNALGAAAQVIAG